MYRRLRIDVQKRITLIVLIHSGRRNGSFDDLAKEAAHDGTSVPQALPPPGHFTIAVAPTQSVDRIRFHPASAIESLHSPQLRAHRKAPPATDTDTPTQSGENPSAVLSAR